MSLDLSLQLEVGSINLTHNLGSMSSHIPAGSRDVFDSESHEMVNRDITLYEAFWRPEEVGIYCGSDLLPHTQEALIYALDNEGDLRQYLPENGWGTYEDLIKAIREMGKHCMMFPHARLESDR